MRIHVSVGRILAVLALVGLGAGKARAKSEFVGVIADHLSLTYQPPCRLCHIQGTTGPGSVQTPFGVSMLGHGLTESEGTLVAALDGLTAEEIDSDGDTVSDIDEMQANTDPNTAVGVPLGPSTPNPAYGCSVLPAKSSGRDMGGGGAVFPVALALSCLARRRRRSTPLSGSGAIGVSSAR